MRRREKLCAPQRSSDSLWAALPEPWRLIHHVSCISTMHAIRRFLMQFALKGIWLPFATALKGISDPFVSCRKGNRLPHAILFDFRGFFGFCMGYLIPFCKLQKGIWYLLELEQKGSCNPFKNKCLHEPGTGNSPLPLRISVKTEENFWKYNNKVY